MPKMLIAGAVVVLCWVTPGLCQQAVGPKRPAATTRAGVALMPPRVDHAGLKKLGWQQACQPASLGGTPLVESIDILHEMTFHHLELTPGQAVSLQQSDVKLSPAMPAEKLKLVQDKLKATKLDVVSYGPVQISADDPAGARAAFEFARTLKAKNVIVSDPSAAAFELIDKLAQEYGVNAAVLTNAPPATLLAAMNGRSSHLGVCADLAAWRRAGLSPAKCVEELSGRLFEIHLTDVDEQGHAVAFGSGTVEAPAVLKQLKAQNFKGVLTLGAADADDSTDAAARLQQLVRATNAFNAIVTELAKP